MAPTVWPVYYEFFLRIGWKWETSLQKRKWFCGIYRWLLSLIHSLFRHLIDSLAQIFLSLIPKRHRRESDCMSVCMFVYIHFNIVWRIRMNNNNKKRDLLIWHYFVIEHTMNEWIVFLSNLVPNYCDVKLILKNRCIYYTKLEQFQQV